MRRGRRPWLRLFVLGIVLLAILEAVPGFVGHPQSALLAELGVADGARVISWANPFAHDSGQPCANLESRFGVPDHLFKNRELGFYASVWPTYQALNAMYLSSLSRPTPTLCSSTIREAIRAIDDNYWDQSVPNSPGAFDQGPEVFHRASDLPRVDDSLWMGLAVEQQYTMTRDPTLLHRAEQVFRLATDNWAPRGGIYWEVTGRDDKAEAVVSNAPAVVLGVDLFRQTGSHVDLEVSERVLAWLVARLRDPVSRLYDDSLTDEGGRTIVNSSKYTYDQGMMVGALAALSTVDPVRYPLSDAVALAERSLDYFDRHHSYGQPGFDVIWAENLLRTANASKDSVFVAQAQKAVRAAMAAEPHGGSDLLTSSSVMALHELSRLPSSRYAELPS